MRKGPASVVSEKENSGGAGALERAADGELLRAFAERAYEEAFQTLVARHGPMVWSTCRRIVGDWHETEDAYQAAFLVLASKARQLADKPAIGPWLHGVATRVALKAKCRAIKRKMRDEKLAKSPASEKEADSAWLDYLDQELERLPDKYRLPLVLCELSGCTRQEAAMKLGWPEGTVAGRLARAREILAGRLRKRSAAATAAMLVGLQLAAPAAAAPAALNASTCEAAIAWAAGAAFPVHPNVISLVRKEQWTMIMAKFRIGVCILAILLGIGIAVSLGRTKADDADITFNLTDKQKAEMDHAVKALQGKWRLVRLETKDGLASVKENRTWDIKWLYVKSNWVAFDVGDGKQTIYIKPVAKGGPTGAVNFVSHLGYDKPVKEKDKEYKVSMIETKTIPSLFEIQGDSLRIAYEPKNGNRPTSVKASDPNTKGLLVFERIK